MPTRTGDLKLIANLNDLLGRELGRNPYSEPVFRWEWSDDLFWPATKTGRKIREDKWIEVPIIGGPKWIEDELWATEPVNIGEIKEEYAKTRQTRLRETWLITKWLSPEDLIHGGTRGLGRGYGPEGPPSAEGLQSLWQGLFPGADFPARGWRIPTDASLPRGPGDSTVPSLPDTEFFIASVRRQTLLSPEALLLDMLLDDDRRRAQNDSIVADICRDAWPAFLNPRPGGKDETFVSFPALGTSKPDKLSPSEDLL